MHERLDRRRRLPLLLLTMVGMAIAVAACASGGTASSASPSSRAAASAPSGPYASAAPSAVVSPAASSQGGADATATATIVDFSFSPAESTVPVGTTVTWTNSGSRQHTVTADDGSFDSGPLAPGTTYARTFDKAGTFTYHCTIHPGMTASIVVTP